MKMFYSDLVIKLGLMVLIKIFRIQKKKQIYSIFRFSYFLGTVKGNLDIQFWFASHVRLMGIANILGTVKGSLDIQFWFASHVRLMGIAKIF